MKVVLEKFFLSLSNRNVKFSELEKLTWRSYITIEVLPTIIWVLLINKKKFANTALDENSEAYIVYVAVLDILKTTIHLLYIAQIATLY